MFGVILAGGSGSRLWPLSRELYPKQLLNLYEEKSLLQSTFERLNKFIPAGNEPGGHACMSIWRLPRGSDTSMPASGCQTVNIRRYYISILTSSSSSSKTFDTAASSVSSSTIS